MPRQNPFDRQIVAAQKQIADFKQYTDNQQALTDLLNSPSDTFSYSGSDIICTVYIPRQNNGFINSGGTIEIEDKLQTLTVSSARSVSPVRRLGETSPTAYTRGSRTIAGSMVFTVGLRDAFINALIKSGDDGEPMREQVLFVDQIPKFSMFLQATNELGGISCAMLINMSLTNFGTTFSIDDIYTESTFTYVAEQYLPLSRRTALTANELIKLKKLYGIDAIDQSLEDLILARQANQSASRKSASQKGYLPGAYGSWVPPTGAF